MANHSPIPYADHTDSLKRYTPLMPESCVVGPGNFWLAKCSYINTLQRIATVDVTDRLLAEGWIAKWGYEGYDLNEWARVTVDCWVRDPEKCDNFYNCFVPESEYITIDTCGGEPKGGPTWRGTRKLQ